MDEISGVISASLLTATGKRVSMRKFSTFENFNKHWVKAPIDNRYTPSSFNVRTIYKSLICSSEVLFSK